MVVTLLPAFLAPTRTPSIIPSAADDAAPAGRAGSCGAAGRASIIAETRMTTPLPIATSHDGVGRVLFSAPLLRATCTGVCVPTVWESGRKRCGLEPLRPDS